MKFFVALAALAAGVSAASTASADSTSSSDCAADYIVTTCLGTENAKVSYPFRCYLYSAASRKRYGSHHIDFLQPVVANLLPT